MPALAQGTALLHLSPSGPRAPVLFPPILASQRDSFLSEPGLLALFLPGHFHRRGCRSLPSPSHRLISPLALALNTLISPSL